MDSKLKEIILIRKPSIKDGEIGLYNFQDDVLGEVLLRFSAQKDVKDSRRRIEVNPEEGHINITIYNADCQKLNHAPALKLTNENAPKQLYVEILISAVDEDNCREWIVRFLKK